MSTQQPVFGEETWLGAQYAVYKTRSAIQFKPIGPTFKNHGPGTYVLERNGAMLINMANAVSPKMYDWPHKVVFALSVTELANMFLVPGALEGKGVNFFHNAALANNGGEQPSEGEVRSGLARLAGACVLALGLT
jgi:hypothetical protein